jgi:glycosyltransferase involved in cell wall biosynthesis
MPVTPEPLRKMTLADEIVIVDTGSKDKTKEISKRFNAKIVDFPEPFLPEITDNG